MNKNFMNQPTNTIDLINPETDYKAECERLAGIIEEMTYTIDDTEAICQSYLTTIRSLREENKRLSYELKYYHDGMNLWKLAFTDLCDIIKK